MRLDQQLVCLGLVPSRSRARDLIRRGFVRVAGNICDKPALEVSEGTTVELSAATPRYVSRGAEKLCVALDEFGFDCTNVIALDIGASTGGFTQVLLERGARRAYAVDVGSGQLHDSLRQDERVHVLENQDARLLTSDVIIEPVGAIVADVSFISLAKALPSALSLVGTGAWLVALVKPQFEVGPNLVGKGGIVRDEAARLSALARVKAWVASQPGWTVVGDMPSPITGGSGNVEYLIGARRDG